MMIPPVFALPRADRDNREMRRYSVTEFRERDCAWIGCEMLRKTRAFSQERAPEEVEPTVTHVRATTGRADGECCAHDFTCEVAHMTASALITPTKRSLYTKR